MINLNCSLLHCKNWIKLAKFCFSIFSTKFWLFNYFSARGTTPSTWQLFRSLARLQPATACSWSSVATAKAQVKLLQSYCHSTLTRAPLPWKVRAERASSPSWSRASGTTSSSPDPSLSARLSTRYLSYITKIVIRIVLYERAKGSLMRPVRVWIRSKILLALIVYNFYTISRCPFKPVLLILYVLGRCKVLDAVHAGVGRQEPVHRRRGCKYRFGCKKNCVGKIFQRWSNLHHRGLHHRAQKHSRQVGPKFAKIRHPVLRRWA